MRWVEQHRGRLAGALLLLTAIAGLAESVWPRLSPYWDGRPLRLQVVTSAFVLAATYLVVNVILARRESSRWSGAGSFALHELRAAANALDGHIYSWCVEFARIAGRDLPRKLDRDGRNRFILWNLRYACEAEASYDNPLQIIYYERFGPDAELLRERYVAWSPLLVLTHSLQDVAADAPKVVRQAQGLVALIGSYAKSAEDGRRVDGRGVIPAWRAYEQARRALNEQIERELERLALGD